MPYISRCALRCIRALGAGCLITLTAATASADATSIVLGNIEYTRDGRVDEEGGSAVETYLEFLLSRLQDRRPQRIAAYLRECVSGKQQKETDGSCALPDFYIQLQISERQGEVQISGAIGRKTDLKNMRTHNLESIRVRMRDLTEGLSRIAKDITKVISAATTSVEQVHLVIACFGSGFEPADAPSGRPRTRLPSRRPTGPTSTVSAYANRLPKALEMLLRDPPRMIVSTNTDARTECGSLEGLQAIAQTAKAQAVLSGRIFTDDKSGLMVLPYIYVPGSTKKVALSVISVPRGANTASFVQLSEKLDAAAEAFASNMRDIDAASYLVARKLGAATAALVGSSKRSEFVKAINDGREVPFYLDRAKEYLSSSPPNYELADALLELAKSKAPRDEQSYLLLATSLTDRTRYAEAEATLRSGLADVLGDSDRKALYLALADNLVRSGDLPAARQAYEEAMLKKLLTEEALLGIAKTYLVPRSPDRSPEKAMQYALEAAQQNPSSPEGYFLAGQIAEVENQFERAEKYYQDARTIAPGSVEIVSRLSALYERWATKELGQRRAESAEVAIRYLTKSIELSPSVKRYYDRARLYFYPSRTSNNRSQDYASASSDYQAALQIARRDHSILAQFPWLMPNLVETLILEGKFQPAKEVAQELFVTLGSDSAMRPSTNPKEIRLIVAFLNAAAEVLDTGLADKELYLLENAALGMEHSRLPWSFSDMLFYLDNVYPGMSSKSELSPAERATRTDRVKQWINRLKEPSL